MVKILAILALLFCNFAIAENSVSKDYYSLKVPYVADNNLRTGYKIETSMDMESGMAGANFSIYSIATCSGRVGSWGVHDCVGVHGTAVKRGNSWIAGGHFDTYDEPGFALGGTAIGVNIEFPQPRPTTNTIGLNMQSASGARGISAVQIQNLPNRDGSYPFKTIIDGVNGNYIIGEVGNTPFGFRFDPVTQKVNLYKNIGWADEVKIGEL